MTRLHKICRNRGYSEEAQTFILVSGRSLFPELNEIVNEAGCKRMSVTQWKKKANLQKLRKRSTN